MLKKTLLPDHIGWIAGSFAKEDSKEWPTKEMHIQRYSKHEDKYWISML